MDSVPSVLYHATWPSKVDSIIDDGLLPGFDGCIYLAGPLPDHAAQFIALRHEIDGMKEMEIDGVVHQVPNVIEHDTLYVFAVYTDLLDPELLHESGDHAAEFWHEDTKSFQYDGEIDSTMVELAIEIDLAAVRS